MTALSTPLHWIYRLDCLVFVLYPSTLIYLGYHGSIRSSNEEMDGQVRDLAPSMVELEWTHRIALTRMESLDSV